MTRRERETIIGDVLAVLDKLEAESESYTLARISRRANMAYDRLAQLLSDLEQHGLVTPPPTPRLTPRGRELLEKYTAWKLAIEGTGAVAMSFSQVTEDVKERAG
ncbi:MAG TPA: winged helix-turn-helix domain-containing protein [Candidatus Thermoplasmatota archaeon]|nr:winged helix-turn-helix domain-containing protein [Candidatus Thermoplasmatota archaeon]